MTDKSKDMVKRIVAAVFYLACGVIMFSGGSTIIYIILSNTSSISNINMPGYLVLFSSILALLGSLFFLVWGSYLIYFSIKKLVNRATPSNGR